MDKYGYRVSAHGFSQIKIKYDFKKNKKNWLNCKWKFAVNVIKLVYWNCSMPSKMQIIDLHFLYLI